jgi:flagellar protein FliL
MKTDSRAGKSMLPLIIVVAVLSIGIGTGLGMFMSGRISPQGKLKKTSANDKAEEKKAPGTVFSLGEMTMNLSDTGTMRYAKITVSIGVEEKIEEEKLKSFDAPLKDAVISVVSNKRFDELHREGGLEKLKGDLKRKIGERLSDIKVTQIYFEGLAMQ